MTKEDPIYKIENVPLFEAVYGKGLISLGGLAAVDKMFDGVLLHKKHLLDIGFGLGGMAHYLADKFDANVTGVEIHPWMVKHAQSTAPEHVKDKLNFVTYSKDGSIPIPDRTIDIAYSKGVLTNVQDKKSLFLEIARVLKPGGQICIIDWLLPEAVGPNTSILHLGDVSHKETETSYRALIEECGFSGIEFHNRNSEYLRYVKELGTLLASDEHRKKYDAVLPSQLRKDILNSNTKLMQSIIDGEQTSTLIRAQPRKPTTYMGMVNS